MTSHNRRVVLGALSAAAAVIVLAGIVLLPGRSAFGSLHGGASLDDPSMPESFEQQLVYPLKMR